MANPEPAPPRTWVASAGDAAQVTRLMVAFRDWWGRDQPPDRAFAAGVERLLADPQTEFLLAAPPGWQPAGVCQLRYRYAIWHDAPDCWLEDLYVDGDARRQGVGRALTEAARRDARHAAVPGLLRPPLAGRRVCAESPPRSRGGG